MADALAGLFAEKGEATTCSAAEAAFRVAFRFNQLAGVCDDGARLGIDVAIAAQVAGVVVDDRLLLRWPRQAAEMACHELAVMLELGRCAIFLPVFLDGAHAMRADGDDLLDLVLRECFEIGLGELLEEQIVAETADGVAGAFLFAQDAEACAEIAHDAGEVGDNLAAFGIVAAHAAEPQAVLLRTVEDGELLLLDELVALTGLHAESIGAAFEAEEELGAMLVFPCAGVDRAATQADEDGQVLDADGALELAGAACGALKGRDGWVVLAKQWLGGCGSEFVEVAAQAQDDFFGVERLARIRSGAVLGAAAALDAGVRLQADEAREVCAGDEAEVFIAGEGRDATEAAA